MASAPPSLYGKCPTFLIWQVKVDEALEEFRALLGRLSEARLRSRRDLGAISSAISGVIFSAIPA